MPFWMGAMGSHDDSSHQGSAKRDTSDGVAGLNAVGDVLALGTNIFLTRSAVDDIRVRERTSGELALSITRAAPETYFAFLRTAAANDRVQTESMKDVASGIAGLDSRRMLGSGVISAFNLLKIYHTDVFTETLVGSGAISNNLAAGTLNLSAPVNNDDAYSLETAKIALSNLPRIVTFRIGALTLQGANTICSIGLSDANSPLTNGVAIYTNDGGATWTFRTTNAGVATSTAILTPIVQDVLTIYATSSRCVLFMHDIHLATHTTNIPAAAIGHLVSLVTMPAEGAGSVLSLSGFM